MRSWTNSHNSFFFWLRTFIFSDRTIRYYEYENDSLYHLSDYRDVEAQKGKQRYLNYGIRYDINDVSII